MAFISKISWTINDRGRDACEKEKGPDAARGKSWETLVTQALLASPKRFLIYDERRVPGERRLRGERTVQVINQVTLADVLGIDRSRVNDLYTGKYDDIPSPLSNSRVLQRLPGPGRNMSSGPATKFCLRTSSGMESVTD